MNDINAFALNLEIALQDKATAALRSITNLAATLETKIQNNQKLFSSMNSAAQGAASGITKWYSKAASTLSMIPDGLMNVKESMQKFVVGDQKTDTKRLQLSKMLFFYSKQDADVRRKNSVMANKFTTMRARHEREYHEKSNKFSTKVMKGYRGELLNKQQLGKLSNRELRYYQDVIKAREKIEVANVREKEARKAAVTGDGARLGVVGRLSKWADNLADMGGRIKSSFTGLFSGIGLGEIASATSILGLFQAGIMKTAQRQEKFHTINYRQLGTVEDLNIAIIKLGKSSDLTMDELEDSTMALRELGATAKEVEDLRDNIGRMNRVSGASTKTTAQMSKQLSYVTKDTKVAGREMVMMTRYQKQFALAGSDVDHVLGDIGEASLTLGETGASGIDAFSRSLMQSAATAKNMGVRIETLTDILDGMQEPFDHIAFLGRESMQWDPSRKMAESAKKAQEYIGRLSSMQDGSMEKRRLQQELIARMEEGYGVSNVRTLNKTLRMLSEYGKVQEKVAKEGENLVRGPEDVAAQTSELMKDTEEAMTDQRRIELMASRTMANIQEAMTPVRKMFKDIMDLFLSDPVYPAIVAWGAIALTVGGAIFGIVTTIGLGVIALAASVVSLGLTVASVIGSTVLTAFSLIPKVIGFAWSAIRGLGQISVSVFQTMASMAGGTGPLLLMMGKAALLAGAAIAGWKIGRWIDGMTGFGDSVDRVNKGQGSFWDYAKTFSNPIGWLSVGYKKLCESSDAYTDSIERQIRMSRAEAKNKFVVQKLELQAAARKANVAGDQARVAEITQQIADINRVEQEEYQNTVESKQAMEAHRIDAQQDLETKAVEQVAEAHAEAVDGSSKQIDDMMRQMKEMSAPMMEKGAEFAKASWDNMQPILEKGGALLADGLKSAVDYIGPALQKIGPMLADGMKTVLDYVGPAAEKFAVAIKAAMLEIGPKLREIFTGLPKAAEEVEGKSKARAETIVTVKLDDQTGRPKNDAQSERLDQNAGLLMAQLEVMKIIAGKLDPTTAQEIFEILKRFLPEFSQNTGLASSANQWTA